MMARNSYTFGGIPFKTQKAAKEHFQWIKTRGAGIVYPHNEDFAFLRSLYWRNPWAPLAEPVQFRFAYHPGHRGAEQGVIITLDTGEDWMFPSYMWGLQTPDHVLNGNIRKHWEQLMLRKIPKKMRKMIEYQRDTYRRATDGCCEMCGAVGVDVDHARPWTFESILEHWLKGRDLISVYMNIDDDTVDGSAPEFSDPDIHASWLDFHYEMAEFRLLCKACHYQVTHGEESP